MLALRRKWILLTSFWNLAHPSCSAPILTVLSWSRQGRQAPKSLESLPQAALKVPEQATEKDTGSDWRSSCCSRDQHGCCCSCCSFIRARWNFCTKRARTTVALKEVLHNSVNNWIALETVLLNTAAHMLLHRHKASSCCYLFSHFDVTWITNPQYPTELQSINLAFFYFIFYPFKTFTHRINNLIIF